MTAAEIMGEMNRVKKSYPRSQAVITGGEPLEQDISGLVAELKRSDYFISIETNGMHFQDIPVDWWTVSPKDAGGFFIHPGLVENNRIHEIKLVVNENLALGVIKKIRGQVGGVPIYLQPEGSDADRWKNTFSLFRRCQEEGIEGIRAGVQLHKIYRVD